MKDMPDMLAPIVSPSRQGASSVWLGAVKVTGP